MVARIHVVQSQIWHIKRFRKALKNLFTKLHLLREYTVNSDSISNIIDHSVQFKLYI